MVSKDKLGLFLLGLSLGACSWLTAGNSLRLDIADFDPFRYKPEVSQLVSDGSFIIVTYDAALHFDRKGKVRRRIEVKDDDGSLLRIGLAYYVSSRKMYWVVTEIGTFFFDQNGRRLARGFQLGSSGELLDVSARLLIELGDRLFAVGMDYIDLWKNANPQVISEVHFELRGNGEAIISKVGSSFCTLTDLQKSFNFNFKLHWLIGGRFHGDLYVINQLTPELRHFVQDPEAEHDKLELTNKQVVLSLPRFKPAPMGWSRAIKTKEDNQAWWSSWSRLTGFFRNGEGYLVVYTAPDPNNRLLAVQLMQQVNREGRAVGQVQEVVGAPMGIFEHQLVLLVEGEHSLSIDYLAL